MSLDMNPVQKEKLDNVIHNLQGDGWQFEMFMGHAGRAAILRARQGEDMPRYWMVYKGGFCEELFVI